MFFVLSKTLNYLTMPLVIITVLFLLAAWVRGDIWRKRLFRTALALLIFFSNDFMANTVVEWWEIPATPYHAMKTSYDWGILLTGVTSTDRLPDDRVYFHQGADRVVHTVDLYKRGIIKQVLVSGGSARLITQGRREADDIQKALVLMGVPEEAIRVERDSRNTYESAVAVKEILGDGSSEVLLITSAYHMPRSLMCFRKAGLKAVPFTTDFYTHPRHYTLDEFIIPKLDALHIWHRLIREWVGILAYKVAGYA